MCGLSSQSHRGSRHSSYRDPRDDSGTDIRIADHWLDEGNIPGALGCSEAQNRGVHVRQADGKFKGRQCQRHAEQVRSQSRDDRSAAGAGWNGWGNDNSNTRFQTAAAARLKASDVPRLKLKWAFGFPTGESSNSQPTVVSGRVFAGSDNGFIYSLDAATGCVYWSFEGGSIVRGSLTVGAVSGQGNARYAVFYGDGHANIFAVNAQDGRLLWKTKVDSHVVARITAGLRYYNGKVFVPVSSSEEFSSGTPDYPCCTSRGSVVALDANTGKIVWKTYVVPGELKPRRSSRTASSSMGRAAAASGIRRRSIPFATRYTSAPVMPHFPAPDTTDGVIAMDINTGKLCGPIRPIRKTSSWADAMGRAQRSVSDSDGAGSRHRQLSDPENAARRKARAVVGTKQGHVIASIPTITARCCIAFSHRPASRCSKVEAAAAPSSGVVRQTNQNVVITARAAAGLLRCVLRRARRPGRLRLRLAAALGRCPDTLFRASSFKVHQTGGSLLFPLRMESKSGNSTPLRNSVR